MPTERELPAWPHSRPRQSALLLQPKRQADAPTAAFTGPTERVLRVVPLGKFVRLTAFCQLALIRASRFPQILFEPGRNGMLYLCGYICGYLRWIWRGYYLVSSSRVTRHNLKLMIIPHCCLQPSQQPRSTNLWRLLLPILPQHKPVQSQRELQNLP